MDAISYSYADKQAKRIKKFINDPDSTSGVLTVPKVIASGESVTIPAGRVAILPDVQVDGTLNVLGDIFIPTGTANSKVVQKVASTDKAIPRFNGTNGDIQNSGVIIDDSNHIGLGTSNISERLTLPQGNDGRVGWTSGSVTVGAIYMDSSDNVKIMGRNGASNSAVDRVTLDSSGNVGIGTSSQIDKLGVKGNIAISSLVGTTYTDGSGVLFYRGADNTQMGYIGFGGTTTPIEFVNSKNTGFAFYNGDILQKTPYGLGYGTGAGGTVTQLTSKSTAVTLNKPSGQITMNNAALAAGTSVSFTLNNNIIDPSSRDIIIFNLVASSLANQQNYTLVCNSGASGCIFTLTNRSAGSLSEAVIIDFAVIKGATA